MHRQPLLDLLDRYASRFPEDEATVERIRSLVVSRPSCFERTCLPGHITASTWIVSHDHSRFLLAHHRKLERWLQLGGHADGELHVDQVALREAREESGLHDFDWVLWEGERVPIDVDVHEIPARPRESRHEHHDLRFLLIAGPGQELRISDESTDLRWFDRSALGDVVTEDGILRMARRAGAALAEVTRFPVSENRIPDLEKSFPSRGGRPPGTE